MTRLKMADKAVEFHRLRRNQGMAENTLKNNLGMYMRFATWWDKTRRSPRSVTSSEVEHYLFGPGGRAEAGLSPSSFNVEVTQLGVFLKWLIQEQQIQPSVLSALIKLPTSKREYLRASAAQVVQMITTCEDPWERWVLALASQTLGRDRELTALRFGMFHDATTEIDYARTKTRDTDKMPYTTVLRAEMRRWKLWLQDEAGPVNEDWYAIPARRWCEAKKEWLYFPERRRSAALAPIVQSHAKTVLGVSDAQVRGQGVHLIRRSMARALFDRLSVDQEPDPLGVVQAMLGHANRKTTETYIGLEAARKRRNELLTTTDLLWTPTADNQKVLHFSREA